MNEQKPVFLADPHLHDTIQAYTSAFYNALLDSQRLFRRRDGTLTYIDPASGPRRIFTIDEFRGMAADLLDIRRGNRQRDAAGLLVRDEAVILFGSEKRLFLPEIELVLHEPGVRTIGGKPELISKPGYYPAAKAYYWKAYDAATIEPRDTTTHLERCFSGVPFQNEACKNNVYAWLVSGMCIDEINHPMMTVTGNDRGVGKSSLVQACGYILTGDMQNAIKPTGEEFEKQLGAKFAAEQRFIMLDNVTTGGRSFKQAKLSSLLTEGRSKQVRRLGQSRNITQTGVLFALTANDCKLDQDLATRSLAVVLYRDVPGPMEPYCLTYAKEHRAEIYGELLGLALRREQDFPIPEDYRTCRFVDWVRYVVPIIVPRFGPLALREAEDLDDRFQDLFGWGADRIGKPFTVAELYQEVMSNPEALRGLWESLSTARGEHAKRIKLGKFLANTVGKTQFITPELTLCLEVAGKKDNSNQYVFKEM